MVEKILFLGRHLDPIQGMHLTKSFELVAFRMYSREVFENRHGPWDVTRHCGHASVHGQYQEPRLRILLHLLYPFLHHLPSTLGVTLSHHVERSAKRHCSRKVESIQAKV
jgi:hypothetical protein